MKCPECGEHEHFSIHAHVDAEVHDVCGQVQTLKFMSNEWQIYDSDSLDCSAGDSKVIDVTYETGCCGAWLTDDQVLALGCAVTGVN